jgi:hypothetical protein
MQFEDFANHNAFDLLARYGTTHLVFNDDIHVRTVTVPYDVIFSTHTTSVNMIKRYYMELPKFFVVSTKVSLRLGLIRMY